MSISLKLTSQEVELLTDIFDSAERWINEFHEYCEPGDFDPDYGDNLILQERKIIDLRNRLSINSSAPAQAGDDS